MKTGLFYLLLLGFVFRLEAQHFQVVDQFVFEHEITTITSFPGGGVCLAVKSGLPGLGFSEVTICRYDVDGNQLWATSLPGVERDAAYDVEVLADSSILVCGANDGCDVGGYGFLVRIAADGTVMWHIYHDTEGALYWGGLYFLTVDPEGIIYTKDGELIYANDLETGAFLDSYTVYNLGIGYVNDMYFFQPDQKLYLAGSAGVFKYDLDNETVATVMQLPSDGGGAFKNILPLGDTAMLVYRSSGKVYTIDENGVTDTLDWGDDGPKNIAQNQDGRLAWYANNSVYVYGPDLSFQNAFSPALNEGLKVDRVGWSNGRFVLAGQETNTTHAWIKNTSYWLQTYDTLGQTMTSQKDVEVLEVIKTNHPVAHVSSPPNSFPYYAITQGTFQAKIRNVGVDTLQKVMLNSGFYGYDYSDICQTSSHKTKLFKDLNLPPGEEVVLDMGLIETPYASYGQFNPAWRVCIWSSTPDGMVDVNHSNNMSCLLVSPVVSSAEPQIFSFSLFPNPASDVCTLTWGEDLRPENIRVYDIHGTLLLDEAADSSAGSHRLNLDTWPSGVYTVFLDKAVRRLVKM